MAEGTIHVHRLGGFRGSARAFRVLVDGQEVGKIRRKATTSVRVDPGARVVRIKLDWCRSPDVEVTIPEGGEAHLVCQPHRFGPLGEIWGITFGAKRYIDLEQVTGAPEGHVPEPG